MSKQKPSRSACSVYPKQFTLHQGIQAGGPYISVAAPFELPLTCRFKDSGGDSPQVTEATALFPLSLTPTLLTPSTRSPFISFPACDDNYGRHKVLSGAAAEVGGVTLDRCPTCFMSEQDGRGARFSEGTLLLYAKVYPLISVVPFLILPLSLKLVP